MYKLFRNLTLFGVSIYPIHLLIESVMITVICASVFTLGAVLFETLVGLVRHQNTYSTLRENLSQNYKLEKFEDDGDHLPSLYNFLKAISCKLKDKSVYLGNNRNLFEYPYRFIGDINYILEVVNDEIKYINKIPKEKFSKASDWLFVNSRRDKTKKLRYEFYIDNMSPCETRDELIQKYKTSFKKSTKEFKTSQEIKYIADRQERLKNLPDHLNKDLFKETDLLLKKQDSDNLSKKMYEREYEKEKEY